MCFIVALVFFPDVKIKVLLSHQVSWLAVPWGCVYRAGESDTRAPSPPTPLFFLTFKIRSRFLWWCLSFGTERIFLQCRVPINLFVRWRWQERDERVTMV